VALSTRFKGAPKAAELRKATEPITAIDDTASAVRKDLSVIFPSCYRTCAVAMPSTNGNPSIIL
jgi:hypothetical protein